MYRTTTLRAASILLMVSLPTCLVGDERQEPRQREARSVLVAQKTTAGAQRTEKENEGGKHLTHCPVYPIAFHGSYTTYYALHHDPAQSPPCSHPTSLDGANNLPRGCPGAGCQPTSERKGPEHGHAVAEDLAKKGHGGGVTPSKFAQGAYILNDPPNVPKVIKFDYKGQPRFARVYLVVIIPRLFDPAQLGGKNPYENDPPIVTAIGYEIKNGPADRQGTNPQSLNDKYLRVSVEIEPNVDLEYDVILE